MRVLLLGSSNDEGQWFEGGKKRHELAGEKLEAELGEPVEFVVKAIWPDEGLSDVVAKWIAKYEPDIVYLNTGSYWFIYRSVPLRLQRLLGKAGPAVGSAGFRFADSKRWAHNAVFRAVRRTAQATIGGDTHFTPEQVIQRITDCIRVSVRQEGIAVVVKGPHGKSTHSLSKRCQARDNRIRLRVHKAFEAACAQHHVAYDGHETPVRLIERRAFGRGTTVGDGLHGNEIRHEHEGDVMYRGLRMALEMAGRWPEAASQAAG